MSGGGALGTINNRGTGTPEEKLRAIKAGMNPDYAASLSADEQPLMDKHANRYQGMSPIDQKYAIEADYTKYGGVQNTEAAIEKDDISQAKTAQKNRAATMLSGRAGGY